MSEKDAPKVPLSRWKRMVNGGIDFVVSTAVILTIAYIFEQAGSPEIVRKAKQLQQHFDSAISAFDPYQIFLYIGDAFVFVLQIVTKALLLVASEETANSILSLGKFLIYPACGAFVIAALPVVVFIEALRQGHVFEAVLSVACWLIVVVVARSSFTKGTSTQEGFQFPFVEVVLITFAILWLVKLAMMAVSGLLFWYTDFCDICAGGSAAATCFFWCTTKRVEHSVTERALRWAGRVLTARIRHVG
jgi:hypothetical protein